MKWSFVRDVLFIVFPSRVLYWAQALSMLLLGYRSKPKFSIVIPCYNKPDYLSDTVESIVQQTYPAYEVIFVNDGAFENTRRAICEAAKKIRYCNFFVIEQKNLGVASARNAGIKAASGDWIVALDYDDIIHADYLKKCSRIIGHMRPDFIYPHSLKINSKDSYWIPRRPSESRILDRCLFPAFSTYRKSLWEAVGGYNVSHPLGMDDWDLFLKFVMHGASLKRLPYYMGTWRGHEANETHAMRRNWECGRAMIVTLSARWRRDNEILKSFKVIEGMSDETYQRVLKKCNQFENNADLYLWRLLAAKRRESTKRFEVYHEAALPLLDNRMQKLYFTYMTTSADI